MTVQDLLSDATGSIGEFASNQTEKVKKATSKGIENTKQVTSGRVQ